MIRCLTGLLEAIGAGVLPPEAAGRILEARNRVAAPETAPPFGLFLDKVFFDEAEIPEFTMDRVPFFC